MSRPKGRAKIVAEQKKLEELAARKAAQAKKKGIIVALTAAGIVAAVGAAVVFAPPPPGSDVPALPPSHLTSLTEPHIPYTSSPPSSGPHVGAGLPPGFDSPDPIPPEAYVHLLEDGGIVLTYDCPDGCEELRAGLRRFMEERAGRMVLTPYEGIVDPDGNARRAAVVAWGRILYLDELNDDTLSDMETFVSLYAGIDYHAG